MCIHVGLAMNQIELEKIADHFDRDHDGYIDLSEISSILRGIRRARSLAKRQPVSESEKIEYEVSSTRYLYIGALHIYGKLFFPHRFSTRCLDVPALRSLK